jgi:3-isopropylmalate/(R)-2-methylmalate dehydratase small subunit
MRPFTRVTAVAAPIDIPKVDTGMIISARYTRRRRFPGSDDYAPFFLHDLRFDADGRERADFVLNRAEFRNAPILVTGVDFGCGSSREAAAYALLDYGVRALVGPSFGEIFQENCALNGILTVTLEQSIVRELTARLYEQPGASMTVDLQKQHVVAPGGATHRFEIDAGRRERLLRGLDPVDATLERLVEIEAFERGYAQDRPWAAR